MEAYEQNNLNHLHATGEAIDEIKEEFLKNDIQNA